MQLNLSIAPVFQEFWTSTKNFHILQSGRTGGKTRVGSDYAMYCTCNLKERDVIVARNSYSDLADSLYSTMCKFIETHKLGNIFVTRQNPLRIENVQTKCNIYFVGIGGSDKNRTKGLDTEHPVEVIIFDELQQVKDQESYEQAKASFMRLLTPSAKMIHIFNPPRMKAHWVNVWAKLKESDSDWLVTKSSWIDMIPYLKDLEIKEILKMRELDKDEYDWMYMGETVGGLGSVYPQFKPEKHLIPYAKAVEKFKGEKIMSVIIGGDNAVSRDGSCLCPIAIFSNGQCAVLDVFYHDPKKDGDLSVSEMIPYIQKWLKKLEDKYGLNNSGYFGAFTPIAFVIDGSIIGIELAKELRYVLNPNRYDIIRYSNKNVIEMAGNMKSVFARNMLYIIDYGGHYNYVRDKFEQGYNVVAEQVESLIWNEKETGFDPIIPNDASDALTYGTNAIFKNMFNLYYVEQAIKVRKEFYDLGGAEL